METQTLEQLNSKRCDACEGDVKPFSPDEAEEQLKALEGWELSDDGKRIGKHWEVRDFATAMAFMNRVGQCAEDEGHHPDMHLEGYRHVRIELSTHAAGGLTQNDFILAAKIDSMPVQLKK